MPPLRPIPGILSTLALAAAAGAAEPAYECRWAETPPVLDGRADEAVWQRAQVVAAFRLPWLAGTPAAKEGTRARLLWDREYIYFFADMDDADVANEVTEHDGPMWQNDVFEIFLKPSEKHFGYYEFEVNPHGSILDAIFPNAESRRNRDQLRRGVFHVEAKVTVRGTVNDPSDRDQGWTVEGRIPWSDFAACGGRPAPGETWHVNFARVNGKGAAQELSTAVGLTQPSFHRTEEYSPLTFIGPAPIARGPWDGGRLLESPEPPTGYTTAPAWTKLDIHALVALAPTPDGEWLWFVDQDGGRGGAMRVGRARAAGDGSDTEILLTPDDQITSLTFHPRFAENGYVYFGGNGPQSTRPRFSRLIRYTVRDGRPDPATRLVILEWSSDGHNGGGVAFGRDGLLFVTSGDGSSDSDRDRVGQDPRSLRAKIMRLDVDHPASGKNYAVPADNPFVGDDRFAPEVWAYGLRNPWRLTYDTASDQLWCGENGQDLWEYAHLVQRGENYGWSVMEGSHRFLEGRTPGPTPFTAPTIEFPHAEFRSLSGGIVYRGRQFPELVGAYVFGDFGTGRIWAAKHDGKKLEWLRELVDTPLAVTHVTADTAGELLIADYGFERARGGARGGVHRLVRAAPATAPTTPFPQRLSETGLFADVARHSPATGVIPYTINAPGWHDGARGDHLLALPTDKCLEVGGQKNWDAPNGTVLAQTLVREGRRIETRVFVKQQEDWTGFTYVWTDDQRDATLATKGGADLTLPGGQSWRVPSRAECLTCHSREAAFALTLREGQLNHGDQLARWEAKGLLHLDRRDADRARRPRNDRGFGGGARQLDDQRQSVDSGLLPLNPENLARYAAPADKSASLELRARSYLAVNCASCHTNAGGGNSAMNFEWSVATNRMQALGEVPQHGDFGLADARVIAPGAPTRSVLIPRMATRGPNQMPPLASRVSDTAGLGLLIDWIASLKE